MTSDANKIDAISDSMILDDIDDLPSFTVFPSGAYLVNLHEGIVAKDINDKPYFEIAMTLKEVIEMTEELKGDELPPKPGDIGSLLFSRDNKFGAGLYKEVARPLAKHLGVVTVSEVNAGSKGLDVMIVVKRTFDAGRDRHNMQIKKLAVA